MNYRRGAMQCLRDPSPFLNEGGFWQASVEKGKKMYTGDEVVGVMPMHKSNTIPVTRKTAIETTRMRRG